MARGPAGLPAGVRLSDPVSLGVIARTFPIEEVRRVLAETGRASERERDLPAHVMVYYAVALALYTTASTREGLRCLLEGLRWLWGAEAVRVAGKGGISQARTRLGEAPVRRLYERLVGPGATPATKGAWHRRWRPVSLDGACLDVADTAENEAAFGRPGAGRGEGAFPQVRGAGRERHPRAVRRPPREPRGRLDAPGPRRADRTPARHAVPGRPAVLRPRALAGGRRHRRRPAVAGEARPAGAARDAAHRRLVPGDRLPEREGPAAPGQRRPGAGGRVPAGGRGRRRAALPAGDDRPGSWRRAGRRAGRAVPRAVGDRGRAGRAEDPPARGAGGPAQQDPGAGTPGVPGPAAGPLRRPRADARGRLAGRRGPGPAVLPPRGAGGAAQAARVRGSSPLGPGPPCMRRCWPRSWRSAWRATAAGGCRVASSAR